MTLRSALLALAFVLAARPARAQTDAFVIPAAEIERSGATRLSDLFAMIDTWSAVSIDGYSTAVSAFGLAPYQSPAWTLFVDGQPVDLASLGAKNLNTLPLHLLQIDSVTVISRPVEIAGVFAPSGALLLHTRTPGRGWTARGHVSAGNEVGDPGPFRYTAFATPNIDRIGPTYLAEVSYADEGWFVRAGLKADEHHATDAAIDERVRAVYVGIKKARLFVFAPSITLGVSGRHGRHRLFAGTTRFQDLRFFEPIGIEVPTDAHFRFAGLDGDFAPGKASGIRYRLSFTSSDHDPRPNQRGFAVDWRQDRLHGNVEARFAPDGVRAALGAAVDARRVITTDRLTRRTVALPRLYARLAVRPAPAWTQRFALHLARTPRDAFSTGRLGFEGLATSALHPGPRHRLTLALAYVVRTPEEENGPWLWSLRGYRFFERSGADLSLPPFLLPSRTVTADLAWRWRRSPALTVDLTGAYRLFRGLTLASTTFHVVPDEAGFAPRTAVHIGVAGQVYGAAARVLWRPVVNLEQRFSYAFLRPVSGADATFRQAWAGVPRHRASYTVRFAPVPRLSLYARVRFESKTLWPGFRPAETESGGRIPSTRPAYVMIDLTVQKRFWRDHLRAAFSFRNLTNGAHRPHPAGAVTNLTVYFHLEARFGGR
jgi:hypothetical protein